MMINKSWWKLLFDLVILWMLSSDVTLDFHDSVRVVPLKYLMYFLLGIKTKYFWNISKEKCFAALQILNLSIKSFVNPFVNIALTFSSILFDVTSFSLLSKCLIYEISNSIFAC